MSGRAGFRWLWAGQTASVFGTAISALAVPTIAIVTLHASPFAVGLLQAVQFAAYPLVGLAAGVWVDRWSRRSTMLIADVVRLAALATIPLAAFAHVLGFAQLVAVAAFVGTGSVFFEVAYQSLVPSVVDRAELEAANARLEFTNSAAQIAGSGMAGALIAAVGAPLAVVVDAASYAFSVLTLAVLRVREVHRETAAVVRAPFVAELRAGLAAVLGSPVLVRIAAATAIANLGIAMIMAVYLLYLYRVLHLSPAVVGVLLAVSNLGFAGALLAPRIGRRFGAGRTMLWALGFGLSAQFALPLAQVVPPLPILFGAEFVMTACVPVYNITQISLRQRLVPSELLGRANATLKTVVLGTLPLGTLLGGTLGGALGIVPTLVIGAAVSACAIPWLLTAPIRALRAPATTDAAA